MVSVDAPWRTSTGGQLTSGCAPTTVCAPFADEPVKTLNSELVAARRCAGCARTAAAAGGACAGDKGKGERAHDRRAPVPKLLTAGPRHSPVTLRQTHRSHCYIKRTVAIPRRRRPAAKANFAEISPGLLPRLLWPGLRPRLRREFARSRFRILQSGVEQVVLPGAVDTEIFAGIAFAYEAGVFQEPDRAIVGRNACRFQAMQPQGAEGERNNGAYRRRHVALAGKRLAHPVAEAAGLRDAAPDIGKRQSAEERIVRAAKNQKGIALVGPQILGIAPDPAAKGAAA